MTFWKSSGKKNVNENDEKMNKTEKYKLIQVEVIKTLKPEPRNIKKYLENELQSIKCQKRDNN